MLKWQFNKESMKDESLEDGNIDVEVPSEEKQKEDLDTSKQKEGVDTSEQGYSCRFCDKKITDEYIIVGVKIFHPDCFRCSVCGDVIDEEYTTDKNDKIICLNHNNDVQFNCSVCFQPIDDSDRSNILRVEASLVHKSCFRLSCNQNIFSFSNKAEGRRLSTKIFRIRL